MKDKPGKIRGKNFTVQQYKRLNSEGYDKTFLDDWLFSKVKMECPEGSRRLGQGTAKDEIWILIHKETGRKKEIIMS